MPGDGRNGIYSLVVVGVMPRVVRGNPLCFGRLL